MAGEPAFSLGIEEEYMVIDPESRALVRDLPDGLMESLEAELGDHVSGELMACQIEIGTEPHATWKGVREELKQKRAAVVRHVEDAGLGLIAASTHPFTHWRDMGQTNKDRYKTLINHLQAPVRHLLISGQHVHCGIEDPDLRIDLMNQMTYFLPHILALTTSSPFWQGDRTGLHSYRLTVFDALPRTGLPDRFENDMEFRRYIDMLVKMGQVDDGTMIWWDIRPHNHFPTVETRVMDLSARVEDSAAVAGLIQCLFRYLWRLRCNNQRWRLYPHSLIEENLWLARRYGIHGDLMDLGRREKRPYKELIHELTGLIWEDAEALDCVEALEHVRHIANTGTCATGQLSVFDDSLDKGADRQDALIAVVDWLREETRSNLS